MCAFVGFIVVRVTMVAATGFVRNMNHIMIGTDDLKPVGTYAFFVMTGAILLFNAFANYMAWRRSEDRATPCDGDSDAGDAIRTRSRRAASRVQPR